MPKFPPSSVSLSRWECRSLCMLLIGWSLIISLGVYRYSPPSVVPATAPSHVFSAERAGLILEHLVGDDIPHPSGSEQNVIVRQRIVGYLEQLGYSVAVQPTRQHPYGDSERPALDLVNILAKRNGTTGKPPIMLTAHYDSRPEGPGASDDGVGVATVLEIARMLSKEAPPERSVIFLITDGEELGLLGAKGFVESHPWADDIATVINLEARGTDGPSLMFETGSDSLWLIRMFSRSADRPLTSSLFFEIYRQLPNDTDFSIFKEHGIQGYNFAFIGNVKNYHTPEDNFANASLESMQHHGDNALGLVRRLIADDIEGRKRGRAVYFDLFGYQVVSWPESWSVYFIGAILFLLLTVSWKLLALENDRAWQLFKGFVFSGATTICLTLVGTALNAGLTVDSVMDNPFPRYPIPVAMSFWSVALLLASGLAFWNHGKTSCQACWIAGATTIGLLGILTVVYAPGASYLFLVPSLLAVSIACALSFTALSTRGPAGPVWGAILAVSLPLAVGLVWLPLERMFYDAVGFQMNLLMVVRVTIVMATALPVLMATGRSALVAVLACAGIGAVTSVILATVLN